MRGRNAVRGHPPGAESTADDWSPNRTQHVRCAPVMSDPRHSGFVLVVAACSLCGSRTVCQDGLCSYCRDIRLWSAINRRFCALIHREWPLRLDERM
jgi:hypothetical protein